MTIKFDRSAETGILITCTLCDYWFSYRFNQDEAYDSGAAHALRAHEDSAESERVRALLVKWSSRNVSVQVEDARHGTSGHAATGALERTDADSVTHSINNRPRPRSRR